MGRERGMGGGGGTGGLGWGCECLRVACRRVSKRSPRSPIRPRVGWPGRPCCRALRVARRSPHVYSPSSGRRPLAVFTTSSTTSYTSHSSPALPPPALAHPRKVAFGALVCLCIRDRPTAHRRELETRFLVHDQPAAAPHAPTPSLCCICKWQQHQCRHRGVLLSCSNSPLPFCAASAHQLFLARHIKPIPNSVTDALGSPPAARRPEPAPPHRPSPAVALLLTGSGVYLSYRPRPPVKRRGRPPTTLFRPCSEGLTSLQWLTCSFEHVPC